MQEDFMFQHLLITAYCLTKRLFQTCPELCQNEGLS